MTQTLALLLDAYRQLNARKIFWITMILNLLCVACFAIVGITSNGISLFGWVIEIPGLNTGTAGITQGFFYKMMFSVLGVDVWLTWVAAILGLVTTASIFPEFISSGSIDVVLSKPIGRIRLFITKYVTGLLFVILQVSVFTTSCFFVIGLRGGIWAPGIFIAIPLVVLFFSYLFSICTLLGVLTRSTIAALLLTILCWFGIYIVQTAETTLLLFVVDREQEIHAYEDAVERIQEQIDAKDDPQDKERWGFLYDTLKQRKTNLQEAQDSGSGLITAHEILHGVMTFLPKTGETVDLLKRRLISMAELPDPRNSNAGEVDDEGRWESNDEQRGRALEKRLRQRNPTWILGTSAIFELVMICLGCWIFCRRDY